MVHLGNREINASRYRYRDKAVSYWIDQHDLIVKRVNSYKQQEMTVADQQLRRAGGESLMTARGRAFTGRVDD